MRWSVDDWFRKAEELSDIYERDYETASKQLTHHRHFIEVKGREFSFVSVHRVLHGLKGYDPRNGPRSGQNIRLIAQDLEGFGFERVQRNHPKFDVIWRKYLHLCQKVDSPMPSGANKLQPKDRSFFLLSSDLVKSFQKKTVISPQDAVRLGGELEGAVVQITANRHERSVKNRKACIEHFRRINSGNLRCESCRIDFGSVYGRIGEGFMHIHHKDPLGDRQEEHRVNPTQDLVPLCPNCHAMAHRELPVGKKPRSPEKLTELRSKGKYCQ